MVLPIQFKCGCVKDVHITFYKRKFNDSTKISIKASYNAPISDWNFDEPIKTEELEHLSDLYLVVLNTLRCIQANELEDTVLNLGVVL